ncbi:hypothetical protein, partial [Aeromonas caviae]|uniref:hypothetical protein n=1 Tax=Aeromonas caviae TaxID=648 RepID=UPI001CC4E9A3
VVGLLAVVLAVKGMTSLSGGWFMGLLGLHDVFSWAAPSHHAGAAQLNTSCRPSSPMNQPPDRLVMPFTAST